MERQLTELQQAEHQRYQHAVSSLSCRDKVEASESFPAYVFDFSTF